MTWLDTGVFPVDTQRRGSLDSGQWITVAQDLIDGIYADDNSPPGQAFYRVTPCAWDRPANKTLFVRGLSYYLSVVS